MKTTQGFPRFIKVNAFHELEISGITTDDQDYSEIIVNAANIVLIDNWSYGYNAKEDGNCKVNSFCRIILNVLIKFPCTDKRSKYCYVKETYLQVKRMLKFTK